MAEDENLDELEDEDGGEGDGDAGAKAKKKGFSLSPMLVKVLMGVLGVAVIGLVAGGIAFFVARSVSKTSSVVAGVTDDMVKSEPPNLYSLGEFNQTTADLDAPRFVKVEMHIAFKDNLKGLTAELPGRYIILRDKIADIISTYPYDVLSTVEGKRRLKEDIKREINNELKNGQIDDVYFDNFLVN